jgi:integrase
MRRALSVPASSAKASARAKPLRPGEASPSWPGGLAPAVEAARGYVAASRAEATRRAYTADWRAFQAWADEQEQPALPALPELVSLYLAALAKAGRKVSTIERALAGIAAAHRAAGYPWQKGHPAIGAVLSGIRRTHGASPTKKASIEAAELEALVSTLGPSLAGLRDRALLLVGWFGAFRRSELAALSVADVCFTADGLEVRLARSKTDQEGEGYAKGLPYANAPELCPVRALRRYLDEASIDEGPLFRAVDRRGRLGARSLCDRSVARIVQRAAATAGLDASRFAGHSLRAGFATTAARKGRGLDAIMRQTGHRSERVARGYVRHGSLFTANAASGLL